MDFGKIADISKVDFSLPADPPRTIRVLERAAQNMPTKPNIYVGTTGWSNKEWVGKWYPAKTQPGDYLYHYSRLFNTIEFNTTHYRIPDADLIARWYKGAAPDFRFCPKIPQEISHRARLQADEPTLRFTENIAGLHEKLGPCFIQLPDHHGPQGSNLIRGFMKQWPREMALQWELRNPEWFTDTSGPGGEIFDAFEAAGHGTVITDVAGRRDVLHMQLTTPVLMLRFVGNLLHPTDYTRADEWIARIADWSKRGLQSAYLFIHQHDWEIVPEYAAYWVKGLNKACGVSLNIPTPIQAPIQGTLF